MKGVHLSEAHPFFDCEIAINMVQWTKVCVENFATIEKG